MSNSEPRDASHYHNGFSNPAGRINELENMLEFAKEEIESFRGKWISEKRKAEQLQARVAELERDAARYQYIRVNQYWTRSEGNDIDPGFSCVGTKFDCSDDFSARIMLDHHIDRRLRQQAEQAGGE